MHRLHKVYLKAFFLSEGGTVAHHIQLNFAAEDLNILYVSGFDKESVATGVGHLLKRLKNC
jgi:hypothetical protein